MKQKFYFRIGVIAVMAALLAACNKDDTKPPTPPVTVNVKALSSPADAATIELEAIENVVFEWEEATAVSRTDEITYELLFDYVDSDFSNPLYTIPSDENGTLTKATVSKNVLIDIAREWGAEAGETATLTWSVRTTQGSKALISDQTRSITLVRPQAVEPAGPPIVTELLSPEDQKEIELASTPTLSFKWAEAESNGETAVRYSLLFDVDGGDFSEPLFSTVSASNGLDPRVALTAKQLDAIAKAAGIEPETQGTIIWTVMSTMGEETYMSEEKSALKVTRLAEISAIVTTLKSPDNWAEIDILSTTEGITFEWEPAATTEENVTYELLFDKVTGNFTQPLKTYTSANNGIDPNLTLSQTELSELASIAGAGFMTPATIKWKVLTKAGDALNLSATLRNITLIGGSLFNVGDDLYMGGAGAEAGQKFRYVDNGQSKYYEIYTEIQGNQPFYFYTGENDGDGARLIKNSNGDGIKEVDASGSESSSLSQTGIYHITFDCDAMTAKFETVERVRLRYPINGSETTLNYAGKGVWKRDHHLIALRNESWGVERRYKFRMTVDGVNVDYGWAKSTAADGTRYMKSVKVDDWTETWDFPADLCDPSLRQNQARYYTNVVFDMSYSVDPNFPIHRFEGKEDSYAYYNGDLNVPGRAVWEAAADSCTFILIDQFMNKNKGTFWASAENVLNNSSVLYWQQAYPMHTMLYSYQRIKDSDPGLAAEYKNYADLWVRNNGNNWYGNKKNGFYNEYTDDMAWMSLVFLHMYEIFGEEQYLTKAKEIYGYMTESQRIVDDSKGWGLIWKINGGGGRNACTNTPAIITAAKLYQITGTQQYLDEALKLYGFMSTYTSDILTNGRVEEPALTYTQGCWIEGCRLLYHITGDPKYRDNATIAVNYTMNSGRCTNSIVGILRDEGTSGDQSNFKGGLMPYMINYINDTDMPADKRQEARTFMIRNARYMWFHNMDKTLYPKTFANYSFSSYYNEEGNPGSLGAHNSAAALLEGITRLTDL